MKKKKEITLNKNGFKTVWRNGDEKGSIVVDVYDSRNNLVLEWLYGKVAGASILGNAALWEDQAIVQANAEIEKRLEELRKSLKAENISAGELVELQSLSLHIQPGDVELLEAAGVPEHSPE